MRGRANDARGRRLSHGTPRSAQRSRFDSDIIDLGNEPPLSVDGGTGGIIDRRRVSAQWFSGTILTGVCGAALMGGAVFASLDGETNFATVPERVEHALRGAIGLGEKHTTRKADRLPPVGESNATRHVIRVTTTARAGDREVVRVRPYVRVAANLSLGTSDLSASVPPFNAQKFLAAVETDGAPAEEQPGAEPDAEVSFVTRDLAGLLPRAKVAAALPLDEVMARVRDTANWTGSVQPRYQLAGIQPTAKLAYATEGDPDPYAGFETRIVPENITLLPKTASQATGGNAWNERAILVKKGDNIATILRDLGATPEEIRAISAALGARGRDGGLREGQKLRILLAASGLANRMQPIRVIVTGDSAVEAVVALSDKGRYVPVDVTVMNTEVADASGDEEDDGTGVRLYQSIYETALRNNIPRGVIENMLRIYSYDVDFQQKTQPGDSFDVLFGGGEDENDSKLSEVLFASLTVGGESKRFYRYQTPDDGVVDYYDETGKSAKKFLVRKPLATGIMRSGFGGRNHPLLGYTKMHTGVDWAAPLGTPIYASGNGLIDKVGWESGYGKYIRIRHANGYETAYGHMTAFARSIQPGARVRQGQVIGYVGSTGLSTGPHLHYEILVNGRFVDPLRLRLPRGRVLDGAVMASFEQERERLEGMLSRAGSRLAQTSQTVR
jgi:murein DD-endopeptidase MepM/ murein hydrolase activator NlpD